MINPRVSILMPVFNKESFLKEAIESILNQTYWDFEFLICDDKSTDNSIKVIEGFTDSRIKLFKNEMNLGVSKTMNFLISLALGEYLIRMDADDISLPDRVRIQVEFMDAHPLIGVSSGNIKLFGNQNDIWILPESSIECSSILLFKSPIAQGASIIRKEVLIKSNLRYLEDGNNVGEDYIFWYQLSKITLFGNLKEELLHYRILENSLSHSSNYLKVRRHVFEYVFRDLNLPISKIDIHLLCTQPSFLSNKVEIIDSLSWINYLIKWNRLNLIFDPIYFERHIYKLRSKILFIAIDRLKFSSIIVLIKNRAGFPYWKYLFSKTFKKQKD